MPLDSEKKRLEARLLHLLSQALQERNRDDIVGTSLELGALYLSGDLYDKSEECFRRVLEEPVSDLALADETAQAEAGLAQLALRRGHLTLAGEALDRAEKHVSGPGEVLLAVRRLQCQRDIQQARYQDVVDNIETTLSRESPDRLGDARVDFMVLEGRARHLLGRNRQALRLLEKALELAASTGYEAGTALTQSELGSLQTSLGDFKAAHEQLSSAVHSGQSMGRQFRLDLDRRRLGTVLIRMGRWEEAETCLRAVYDSSRALRTLENRLGSQLALAELALLSGETEQAHERALDAMEVARAAGFVRRHVQGMSLLGAVAYEKGDMSASIEALREAEALYARVAPESALMIRVHGGLGRALGAQGERQEAFQRLMRAHNLARETGSNYERLRVDGELGLHFKATGDERKASEVLAKAAAELGTLGAKFDVARVRLWYARLLCETRLKRDGDERDKETKLARSNVFEARRLLEPMGASSYLSECAEIEALLQEESSAPPRD